MTIAPGTCAPRRRGRKRASHESARHGSGHQTKGPCLFVGSV